MRHYLVGPHRWPDLVYTYVKLVTIIVANYLTPDNIKVFSSSPQVSRSHRHTNLS